MAVGSSNPCLFSQESTDTIAWVHGDDVVIVGEEETLLSMEEELQKYPCKPGLIIVVILRVFVRR